MPRLRLFASALSVIVLASLIAANLSGPALAVGSQTRTFVATTGSDANSCSRTAPCRTFGAALAQTASGGEIVALDSGGYGAVTITQAVSIAAAPGVQASISPASGSAITVNAGASDAVVLRNLQLTGQGANYGVEYQAGGSLHIEDLSVTGFALDGIHVELASAGNLYVTDTVARGNGSYGIYLYTASGTTHATILRTRLEANFYGLSARNNTRASVKDSVASGNELYSFIADSSSAPAELNLEGCLINGNTIGIAASSLSSTGTVRVSNCTVTDNTTGIFLFSGGSILSRGNNTVEGNGANGLFSGTYAAK